MSTELGHHAKRVYLSQEGALVVPSSARMVVESGGIIACKPSTGGIGAIFSTQVANALPNRGLFIIKTTDKTGIDTIAQPTPRTIGAEVTVIWDTTAKRYLRLATAAGSRDVRCGSSSASVIIKTSDAGKFAHKAVPVYGINSITLRAASTDRWIVTNLRPDATGVKYFIFTSCT